MKLISWNVNGLRACLKKGFNDFFRAAAADLFCLQETKLQPDQVTEVWPGYTAYWHSAVKKGYSGTAVLTRTEPLSVTCDIGSAEHCGEGRVMTLEFADFQLVNVYTPNSQRELARLAYRQRWDDAFRAYLQALDERKPLIVCGDLNVAHQEIDLRHPGANRRNAGFTDEERGKFSELLQAGFVDTFRHLYPARRDAYTWWSYFRNARANNSGWRIDYFLVSRRWLERVRDSVIYPEVLGSDHCPVGLEIM
ncbi:MAG: exodeoxyribonuclease III [Gracilibacteraceae bacterium]|nr:exodeoxyribonuclease III [Gracilibacteraceae bacterium]